MTFPGTLAATYSSGRLASPRSMTKRLSLAVIVRVLKTSECGAQNQKTNIKRGKNKHMEPRFTSRRGATGIGNRPTSTFAPNRNTVRLKKKGLGSLSQILAVIMLTIIMGLIYVSEGTRATSYDYEISNIDTEISEMNAKKDDLAVEQARLNSIATAKDSTVAASMEDATVSGYVAD